MSTTPKRKKFDMTTVLQKVEIVKEIPPATRKGKSRIDWTPLLNVVKTKGIVKLSENDVIIGSVINGMKKEAERQKLTICFNTRRIDKVLYLFITKK